MQECPVYWRTTLEDVRQVTASVKKGKTEELCTSAGGRPVYFTFYGKKNELHRTANLSSSLGARSPIYYADKSGPDYRPTVFLVGCIHGAEFEGTAAILNLIHVLESGRDLMGNDFSDRLEQLERVNWMLVPCANPDGRSRVPFASMVGRTFEDLRYYNQGTWLDGTLCGWPACKKVHPIKGHVSYLGGYFNDDGINLMHDNFFGEKAAETDALLRLAEEYAPDFTLLLHGGDNGISRMEVARYVPRAARQKINQVENRLAQLCAENHLPYMVQPLEEPTEPDPPRGFTLVPAIYHVCGEPCATFESNQGLAGYKEPRLTHEQIYLQHRLLFKTVREYVLDR